MSDIWTKVLAFFTHLISGAEGVIMASFVAGFQAIESSGGALLISAADAAVQAEEASGADSATKFANAVAAVKGTLVSQGAPVLENAVRLAVEAGVARLRANLAAPVVEPPIA